ncbi:MAG: enoyl-CoA hydratase/isomerase family protein [Gemmatimonadaceae bacterium]
MTRIRIAREAGIGRIALARPEKKNALDRDTATELLAALRSLDEDPDVRVVLLTADGDDFCAGADLEALESLIDASHEVLRNDAEALGQVFLALRAMAKPVAAAVQGRALAGGAGLANACDIVLAHENAQFGYPEVRVGFVPAMVMTMLRRSVGEKRAFDLVITGRLVSAREAVELGLASRIITAAEWASGVESTAAMLARMPPSAVQMTKRLFYELDGRNFPDGIALGVDTNVAARETADFRDGVKRFVHRPRDR